MKKESKNTDMLPGYVRFRVNIKKTSREKFWALKKKLGKSFGQLIMQWVHENYVKYCMEGKEKEIFQHLDLNE